MKSPFAISLRAGTWLKADDGRVFVVFSSSWTIINEDKKKPWQCDWELSEIKLLEYLTTEPVEADIQKLLSNLENGRIEILKSAKS